MQHLADLLATLPLPELPDLEGAAAQDPRRLLHGHSRCNSELVHDLGAGLPAGHLHVWGGPSGAGKTAFLLCLLQGAAAQGRRVVYATYDLPAESLAMRLLAMTAGLDLRALPDPGGDAGDCALAGAALERAHAARSVLAQLPFEILPARGFSAGSLRDRLVRMPFRASILAVDYLQAVIRAPGSELGAALRDLSEMAAQLHVAVVCAVRPGDDAIVAPAGEEDAYGQRALQEKTLEDLRVHGLALPDRIGWIAPLEKAGSRQAQVLHNPHGHTPAMPLHLDEASGSFGRADATT